MSPGKRPCCVHDCMDTDSVRHHIPTDARVNCIWLQRINNAALYAVKSASKLRNYVVCHRHFDTRCFEGVKLKRFALPTLDLPAFHESSEDTCFYWPTPEPVGSFTPKLLRDALKNVPQTSGYTESTEESSVWHVTKPTKVYGLKKTLALDEPCALPRSSKAPSPVHGRQDLAARDPQSVYKNHGVCDVHFPKEMKIDPLVYHSQSKLKFGACPKLLDTVNDDSTNAISLSKATSKIQHKPNAVYIKVESEFEPTVINEPTEICNLCLNLEPLRSLSSSGLMKERFLTAMKGLIGYDLPGKVCENCFQNLSAISKFITICKRSYKALHNRTSDTPETQTTEETPEKEDQPTQTSETTDEQADQHQLDIDLLPSELEDHFGYINMKFRKANGETRAKRVRTTFDYARLKKCEFCGSIFSNFKKHLELNPKCRRKRCHQCGGRFRMLQEHYKSSPKCRWRVRICEFCSGEFRGHKEFNSHQMKEHRVELKIEDFICHYCGRRYERKEALTAHLQYHRKSLNVVHMCEICGGVYKSRTSLRVHLNKHTRRNKYSCSYCDKIFYTNPERSKHEKLHRARVILDSLQEKIHMDFSTGVLTCYVCNTTFNTRESIRMHFKLHDQKCVSRCHVCFKGFRSPNVLRKHRILHSGGRPFVCSCGAGFTTENYFKRHAKEQGHALLVRSEEEAASTV